MRKDQILEREVERIMVSNTIDGLHRRLATAEQENARLNSLLYGGRCVYCGEVVGADTLNQDLSDEVLKEHIKTCAAHPYVRMKERAEAAEKERDELRDEVKKLNVLLTGYKMGYKDRSENCEAFAARAYRTEDAYQEAIARAEQSESQLTAAQQSAKEQFGLGMERAAEICLELEDGDKHFYTASKCARLIREAAKEGTRYELDRR